MSYTVFAIFAFYTRKWLVFPTPPLVDAHARKSQISDETYLAKTGGIGLPYGENCIILTSTVLTDPPV